VVGRMMVRRGREAQDGRREVAKRTKKTECGAMAAEVGRRLF